MGAADLDEGDSERKTLAVHAAFEELIDGGWGFHGWTANDSLEIGLSPEVLKFIVERVRPGDRTVETGSGYSTVAFAIAGSEHTAVSPAPWEHERIRRWCDERGISLSNVSIREGFSQEVLPGLGPESLDFVLIDGDHSFPTVFVDYWYTASRLRPGGLLVVDDTQIRTGDVLCEFLEAEADTGRWRTECRFPTTAVFMKMTEQLIDLQGWAAQPYCTKPSSRDGASLVNRFRRRLRSRTRLRELRNRLRGTG